MVYSISGLKTQVDEADMPVILNQNWSKNSNLPALSSLSYSHIKAQIPHRNTAVDITIRERRGVGVRVCVQERERERAGERERDRERERK